MKVQRPHLPPLNTAVHRLEDGMILLSGPLPGERETVKLPCSQEGGTTSSIVFLHAESVMLNHFVHILIKKEAGNER